MECAKANGKIRGSSQNAILDPCTEKSSLLIFETILINGMLFSF